MRRVTLTITTVVAMLAALGTAASAEQPASPRASCVAVITSYEASQLTTGFVGHEVSALASPGFGRALVSPLAQQHLGSIETCFQAEG